MKHLVKYIMVFAVLGTCLALAPNAGAQRVVVGVGVGPGYVGAAPVCAYGYYPYAPYACAPYGYYGPSYFSGGIFIGAGPWFHGGYYGRPGYWGRPGYGWHGNGYVGHGSAYVGRGAVSGGGPPTFGLCGCPETPPPSIAVPGGSPALSLGDN